MYNTFKVNLQNSANRRKRVETEIARKMEQNSQQN